jgi:hypothetical protein
MKAQDKKIIIMYDSPESARYVTNIEGWVDINNRFYGKAKDAEHMARWSSCTHLKCECGKIHEKGWMCCEDCRNKHDYERYIARPFKEWDEDSVVYCDYLDKYFRNADEIEDYLNDDPDQISNLRLIICEPNEYRHLEADYFDDILPEAFAVVREAAYRTIGQRHFDVQLMGGMVLHQGKISEIRLTSKLPTSSTSGTTTRPASPTSTPGTPGSSPALRSRRRSASRRS